MIYFAMKRYREAMADFNAYLAVSSREDPGVGELLKIIHQIRAVMN